MLEKETTLDREFSQTQVIESPYAARGLLDYCEPKFP